MVAIIIICVLLLCCFSHRRVLKALFTHAPVPKAPNWHFWVKKEDRRG